MQSLDPVVQARSAQVSRYAHKKVLIDQSIGETYKKKRETFVSLATKKTKK